MTRTEGKIIGIGAGSGIIAALLGVAAGLVLNHQDIEIDLPSDLESAIKYKTSLVEPVTNDLCSPLQKQWEKYAKQNGLVNENGEPLVTLHCSAKDNEPPPEPDYLSMYIDLVMQRSLPPPPSPSNIP